MGSWPSSDTRHGLYSRLTTEIEVSPRKEDRAAHPRKRESTRAIRPGPASEWPDGNNLADGCDELPLLFQEFDELGRGVIVLDHSGRVRRQNARAEELLAGCFGRTDDDRCPLPLLLWIWTRHQLLRADAADPQRLPVALMLECAGRRVEFRLQARNGWILLVVDERRSAPNPSALRRLGLTPREAEVLAWVAEGKTNREVATILSMGPRTVQKHMEHVLAKLGAETRTAAARIALQVMHAS